MATQRLPDSAVYVITCCDGRAYVGSSTALKDRWKFHRTSLRGGRSSNRLLQAAWSELGEEAFTFAVLEEAPPETLIEAEQRWLDRYSREGRLFNIAMVAGSNQGLTASPETRAKMSATRRGLRPSPETLARLSKAKAGENHPCAKIGEAEVHQIRAMIADGLTQDRVAAAFGLSRTTVSLISSRKRWAHV